MSDQRVLDPLVSRIFKVDYYLVTVCSKKYECLFGEIVDSKVKLNDSGRMIQQAWIKIKNNFPQTVMDEHIVMPNHIHGILGVKDKAVNPRVYPIEESPQRLKELLLPVMIEGFKIRTTKKYVDGVRYNYWHPIQNHLWEEDYYQVQIKSIQDLGKVRKKIQNDPYFWKKDEYNPININK